MTIASKSQLNGNARSINAKYNAKLVYILLQGLGFSFIFLGIITKSGGWAVVICGVAASNPEGLQCKWFPEEAYLYCVCGYI